MKIAAIADIHIRQSDPSPYADIIKKAAEQVDVLLMGGDLTQEGLPQEAEVLKNILQTIQIPVIAVLGNHDYESGNEEQIRTILTSPSVHILNGDFIEINGVGFAGVKGFMGGFTNRMMPKFGEKLLKEIVDHGTNEAQLLERSLSQLETKTKIVLLHYAPIRDTVIGEPEEIFPFMGLTRLEDPIERFKATMVFHGHAHHGTYEGKSTSGIPIFNVSLPVLQKLNLHASVHEVEQ